MKLLVIIAMISSWLSAYQIGDAVSPEVQQKLSMKENKVYVVDFFASWCSSCKKEIPYISKVHQKIDANQVEIIGVDVDKDIKKAKAFQDSFKQSNGLTFRVVNDPENMVIKEFNPMGMPAIFYIQDSKVVNVIYGAVDNIDEVIMADLKGLLK